jgi:hypothetical protein
MSAISPLSSANPDVTSFPSTPKRNRNTALRESSNTTPHSHGTATFKNQEGDTDRVEKYKCEDYEGYIREDLKSRVFVDFEVFMKTVLHVPADWKVEWGPVIEAVKSDEVFERHCRDYYKQCNDSDAKEKQFYEPLMNIANRILEVAFAPGKLNGESGNPQYYLINATSTLRGGVINKRNLSPDLVVLHDECRKTDKQGYHWANALHVLEVKPFDSALCNGDNMPRLLVDGKSTPNFHCSWL